MIEFKISAPGRIFLSGEHAIMYEKRVVSASLDRRTTLKFRELPNEQGIIKIDFPEVDLSLEVPLEIVRNFLLYDDIRNLNNIWLIRYVNHFITLNGMWSTHEQRFSLKLLFLLLSAFVHYEKLEIRSFHVDVSTELSTSGGLGSSTSFAVCLAACFRHWARLQKGAHDEFKNKDLKMIRHYTEMCEELIQDCTFKIDNYVCIYGKIVYSQYDTCDRDNIWHKKVPEMKILLINSNICLNNRERLQQMAELKHSNTKNADYLLRAIHEISITICRKLNEISRSHRNPQPNPTSLTLQAITYVELQKHIRENQHILYDFDLSHTRLDYICSIAECYGFAAKLTSLKSGFVYILIPPSIQEEQITNLSTKLEAEGFNVTTTSVSCSGVKIDD